MEDYPAIKLYFEDGSTKEFETHEEFLELVDKVSTAIQEKLSQNLSEVRFPD